MQAQDAPSLVATTSKSQVVKNGRVRVEFTINRQGGDDFKAPDFENFRVLSGPNSSISQSWINGKSSYKQSYVYLLSPTKFGDLTIGKASINLDGKHWSPIPFPFKWWTKKIYQQIPTTRIILQRKVYT